MPRLYFRSLCRLLRRRVAGEYHNPCSNRRSRRHWAASSCRTNQRGGSSDCDFGYAETREWDVSTD